MSGAERIVCGTDGTEFVCEWTSKVLAEAAIGEDARAENGVEFDIHNFA
ncbi:MAG: hypothetical protein ACREO5_03945 [Candidatus Binatia bacterium]